jgi:hypothetical protein
MFPSHSLRLGVDFVHFSSKKDALCLIRVRQFGQISISTRTNANKVTTNWTCQNTLEIVARQLMTICGITRKGIKRDV